MIDGVSQLDGGVVSFSGTASTLPDSVANFLFSGTNNLHFGLKSLVLKTCSNSCC